MNVFVPKREREGDTIMKIDHSFKKHFEKTILKYT